MGRALRAKRSSVGLSLRALSDLIGVSFSTLARLEKGSHEPDPNTKLRISNWLGGDALNTKTDDDHFALVHFRAAKNISSKTVKCLFETATELRKEYGAEGYDISHLVDASSLDSERRYVRSKLELESLADKLRSDLKLGLDSSLNALSLRIAGAEVFYSSGPELRLSNCWKSITTASPAEWSAMTVPISSNSVDWIIVLNDQHAVERQNVTYLEEFWHIALGHKLTHIARVGQSYARTFEKQEEDEAFYLAAATLLPRKSIEKMIKSGEDLSNYARRMSVSQALVEFRIKRLGMWRNYKGLNIHMVG